MRRRTYILIYTLTALAVAGCDSGTSDQASTETVAREVAKPAPFTDITERAGVTFIHDNGATERLYMPEIMGAGGALFDADNDGDLDLYLVQGGPIEEGGLPATDRLLRNDLQVDDQGRAVVRFTDVTEASGIPPGGYGMGVATGDIDGDGNVDLYITNFGPNRLLRNRGDGTFEDVTAASGAGDERWSVPATFFDMDGDGDHDLYSGSYVDFRIANHRDCFTTTGVPDYCSPHSYGAIPDRLLRNRGDGSFEDITAASGLRAVESKALGVISGDFNDDGRTDLYVANDGVANQLWINNGDGTFEDTALFAGCALNFEGSPEASMGVDTADVDGDGDEDLFMTHLRGETNTIYLNRGDGTFEDRTIRLGLASSSIPFTGFGTAWIDVENNGLLDLLAVNGAVTVEERLVQAGDPFPYHQRNQLFRNVSDESGLRFEDMAPSDDGPFAVSEVSRGAAFGDIDNDGDVDVVVTNNSGPARVLLNTAGQSNDWLGLRLLSQSGGADALGAAAYIETADGRTLMRRVRTSGSYVSANDPRLLFGLGQMQDGEDVAVTVRWADGSEESFGSLGIRRYHVLVKGEGEATD